jgi:hypothetical protein
MNGIRTWAIVVAVGALSACGNKLSDEACMKIRGEAFETINAAHTCNGDADCVPSEWPGCERPVSKRHEAKLAGMKKTFTEGKCTEPEKNCRKPPEVYCKQGLCVFREKPGQVNPTAK